MIRLLFVRHGATEGNLQKRYLGRTDEPLAPEGRRQIQTLRRQRVSADLVFSSPMLRARESAGILFPEQKPVVVDDFREIDFGIFEGKTAEELWTTEAYQAWLATGGKGGFPQGETPESFKARCVRAFLQTAQSVPEGKTAAFVVHGGVIMAVLEALCGEGLGFYDYHMENGEMLRARLENGRIQLDSARETPHAP